VAETIDCTATCGADGICSYTVIVDLFASELGYFKFEECGDIANPTIAVEVGKVYKFIQVSCVSIWVHALFSACHFV
jgi:hypothetical protein